MLSVYKPDDLVLPPEAVEVFLQKLDVLIQEMKDADAFVFSGGLEDPPMVSVAQLDGDEVVTTDGPFAEDKWYIGGFMIVQGPDMDSGLEWGRKLARLAEVTKLPVEVRPFRIVRG
jgi:hypothetical protein